MRHLYCPMLVVQSAYMQNITSRSCEYSAHLYLSNQSFTNNQAWIFPSLCLGYSCKRDRIGIPPADWDRSIGALSFFLGFCDECPITFVEYSASIFNIFVDIAVTVCCWSAFFIFQKFIHLCLCLGYFLEKNVWKYNCVLVVRNRIWQKQTNKQTNKKRLVCLNVSLKRIISVFLVITTIKREREGPNCFSSYVFSLILLLNAGIVSKSQYGWNLW